MDVSHEDFCVRGNNLLNVKVKWAINGQIGGQSFSICILTIVLIFFNEAFLHFLPNFDTISS